MFFFLHVKYGQFFVLVYVNSPLLTDQDEQCAFGVLGSTKSIFFSGFSRTSPAHFACDTASKEFKEL